MIQVNLDPRQVRVSCLIWITHIIYSLRKHNDTDGFWLLLMMTSAPLICLKYPLLGLCRMDFSIIISVESQGRYDRSVEARIWQN
jgi:hypothetical protein